MQNNSNIVAYKKLIVGPALVLTEHLCFGFPLENLKILKQTTGEQYNKISRGMLSRGLFNGLYPGYLASGLPQTLKGAPVLFAQQTCMNILNIYYPNNQNKNTISGIIGGAFQGFCLTPFQRMRTIATTNTDMSKSRTKIMIDVIKNRGISTLFQGVGFTMIRRSIDWGIRFKAKDVIQERVLEYRQKSNPKYELTIADKMFSGFFAGSVSAITLPMDVCVAVSQKYTFDNKNGLQLVKEHFRENGVRGFLRGGVIRIFHSGWHVMFILGLKDLYDDYFDKIFI